MTQNLCTPWQLRSCGGLALSLTLSLFLSLPASAQTASAKTDKPDLAKSAAAETGAVITESGLVFRSLKDGTGASPAAIDSVRVHYKGTLADGTEFDSSYKRGQPATLPLNRVIKCWTEGLQRMKVGGTARLTCPASIAYGDKGAGGVIPPGATLRFEVELLAVVKP